MINENAIKRFEAFYKNSEEAFEMNDEAFKNNIKKYLDLKKMLHQVDVSNSEVFQRRFSYFYGLNRFVSADGKRVYFNKLESLKNTTEHINVGQLTEEMESGLGKYHFSFCSKMADIINDNLYPIYDSNVRTIFHRRGLGYGHDYYVAVYNDIIDTYKELKNHPVVSAFKKKYQPKGMGYMKILDALFWVMGRE